MARRAALATGQTGHHAAAQPAAAEPLIGWWSRHAWAARPDAVAQALRPLAALYALLAGLHRVWWRHVRRPARAPVPLVVVGNVVAGGAGKTPVVIALVSALQAAGWRPGVISRGYGRASRDTRAVRDTDDARDVGDEPLLIRRRTGVPVWVARRRAEAAATLCAAQPEVDVLIGDDGLQHHALAHDAALVVFDQRGAGNGLRLPAGPLREALPATLPARWRVLYTATAPSTPLPGLCVVPQITRAVPLAGWWRNARDHAGELERPDATTPLTALRGRRLLALAGIGAPDKFFGALREAGLDIDPCPQPDHARYDTPPWPPGTTEVVTTEKDAVKLATLPLGAVTVWVVPLDLVLPPELVRDLCTLLVRRRTAATPNPTPDTPP